jgi:diadenosine tetraphosphate (Ap4A) HIT family hydrolase
VAGELCPFCTISDDRVLHEGRLVKAIWDAYPVSLGHVLIIPRRHVATWFDASWEEQCEMLEVLRHVHRILDEQYAPTGFNIGLNVGVAAGQTVFHLHLHVIPRYPGDVADPTGGVRNVIPEKANYRGK